MTIPQLKEAIQDKSTMRVRTIPFGTELEYKRAICILPMGEGEKVPMVVLEDKNGNSVEYCKITQILGGDIYVPEEESAPEEAQG